MEGDSAMTNDIKRTSTMTDDQLRAGLLKAVEEARQKAARTVGSPIVITLEAMGYRVVPAWVVEMLDNILSKAAEKKS